MNYVFCFDGTTNRPENAEDVFSNTSITNVLKTHLFCGGSLDNEKHAIEGQQTFYFSGVGTYGNWLSQMLNTMFAPTFSDLDSILAMALSFTQELSEEDAIFIFGFSRGAAIARRFASILSEKGISITFLGVYDTVASIGMPDLDHQTQPVSDVVFENSCIAPNVKSAVHCVAIDERRTAFQPVLMAPGSNVKEVWFAGAHSDIGGGYWHDGLSDVCLDFMLSEAQDKGLKLLNLHQIDFATLIQGDSQIGSDDVAIHAQFDGPLHQQKRDGLLSNKTLSERLIRVDCNEDCLPLIHHSVAKRFNTLRNYRPISLRNKPFQLLLANNQRSDIIFGIEGLRAYHSE